MVSKGMFYDISTIIVTWDKGTELLMFEMEDIF